MTQPYLSYRCWLLHAQAVSAAPAASFEPVFRPLAEDIERPEELDERLGMLIMFPVVR